MFAEIAQLKAGGSEVPEGGILCSGVPSLALKPNNPRISQWIFERTFPSAVENVRAGLKHRPVPQRQPKNGTDYGSLILGVEGEGGR